MQKRILFEKKNASDIYQNHKLTLQKEKERQLTRQRLIHFCLFFFPLKAHSRLLPIQPWNALSGVSYLTTAALLLKLSNILDKVQSFMRGEKNPQVYLFLYLLLMVLKTPFILLPYWKSNLNHAHWQRVKPPSQLSPGHKQAPPAHSWKAILSWAEAPQPRPKQWQTPGRKSQILLFKCSWGGKYEVPKKGYGLVSTAGL